MRVAVFLLAALSIYAQDPAYEALSRAYEALRVRDYDTAIPLFVKAVAASPARPDIRKDLAYTYLKTGENDLAHAQFREAMRLDPADTQVALEYAFLSYEARDQAGPQAEARRIFDRIRKQGNATAEQAFQNIDGPLAAGIDRWQTAIARGGASFSAQYELATLAEQRDQLELAASHYEKAWRLLPERRSVLVDLGRVWKELGRGADSTAAWVAASWGGQARAAEQARELLPARYPFVQEFRAALELDPSNNELRRELAYLLLRMDRQPEAEREFQVLVDTAPADLLSATQLGFLLLARGERSLAQPLFERVLAGNDEDLANRVRAVLRIPQVLRSRPEQGPASIDARVMAERSIKAGYLKDALQYLELAHEADPGDFDIMLKLGWTLNLLRKDRQAFRWFALARQSPDQQISAEAEHAWRNLRASGALLRTTGWFYPLYSTRWRDLFSYAQVRTEFHTPFGIRPYVSLRFVGDSRGLVGVASPQLSESSFILGVGAVAEPWRGLTLWGEAGAGIHYRTGRARSDYRGGVSIARSVGRPFRAEAPGWFADATVDGVFMSRFDNDFLFYEQTRAGYTLGLAQLYWNANLTADVQSQRWANFVETGPGMRLSPPFLPRQAFLTVNLLRGSYLVTRAPFTDLRAGFWYAFTR